MKKKLVLILISLLLVFSLFSCKNDYLHDLVLRVYDSTTNSYTETTKKIANDAKIKDVLESPIETFEIGNKEYSFVGWTITAPDDDIDIVTDRVDIIDEESTIDKNQKYYAVYEEKTAYRTVTFKYSNGYAYVDLSKKAVVKGTALGSIRLSQVNSFIVDNKEYSFVGWTKVVPNDAILKNLNDVIDNNTPIEEDGLTLYAVYRDKTANQTLKFQQSNADASAYIDLETIEVVRGTKLGDVRFTKEKLNSFIKGSDEYKFVGWTTKAPLNGKIITTTSDILSENTLIQDDLTYYAVYANSTLTYTVKFKHFEDTVYTDLESKTELRETKLGNLSVSSKVKSFIIGSEEYTFKGWTTTAPSNNEIITNVEVLDGNTQILKAETYYAVYNSVTLKYDVTFKHSNGTSYINIGETQNITRETKLESIAPSVVSLIIGSEEYTFKGWTTTAPSNNQIITDAEVLDDNTQILKAETYYAVYNAETLYYNVTFKYTTDGTNYVDLGTSINNQKRGTNLNTITQPTIGYGGRQTFKNVDYRFKCWTDTQPTNITSGTEFNFDTQITSDKTFYAVYEKEEMLAIEAQTYNYSTYKGPLSFDRVNLYFSRIVGGSYSGDPNLSLQYRRDGSDEWKDWVNGIMLTSGQKIYIRGNNESISKNKNEYTCFGVSENYTRTYYTLDANEVHACADIKVSGNIMSLLKPETKTIPSYCFYKLFCNSSNNRHLISAKDLILPKTDLKTGCYNEMFLNCSSIPEVERPSVKGIESYCKDTFKLNSF